jgi:hypothetical protein
MRGKKIHILSVLASCSGVGMYTRTLGIPRTYAPVLISLRMIDRPSGPIAAMTAISFVPGGKFTTRVPGSGPCSTLRFVGVEEDWGLTSGFVIFAFVIDGDVAPSEVGVIGTTRASGTPINTTYTATNAPTKARPNCTSS